MIITIIRCLEVRKKKKERKKEKRKEREREGGERERGRKRERDLGVSVDNFELVHKKHALFQFAAQFSLKALLSEKHKNGIHILVGQAVVE